MKTIFDLIYPAIVSLIFAGCSKILGFEITMIVIASSLICAILEIKSDLKDRE